MLIDALCLVGSLTFLGLLLFEVGRRDRLIAAFLLLFYLVSAILTWRGFFDVQAPEFPPRAVKVMNAFLLLLIISLFVKRTRRIWNAIPTKRLILWHCTRLFLGAAAVLAAYQGRLAPEFGLRAGWGDVLAAVWAAAYVALPRLRTAFGTQAWNAVVFLDGVVGVATATLSFPSPFQHYHHGNLMRIMNQFPLALIACFGVPLLLTSQFVIFGRGRKAAER